VFDLDEGFHALQNLDAQGRKALVLAGKLWKEVYRDEGQHRPATFLVSRYLTELSELSKEVRELRRRLDDALDDRERLEIDGSRERDRELRELRRQLEQATEAQRRAWSRAAHERERAEQAELQRDHLTAEIEWLRRRGLEP
jgi:predicted  nucleic acid-binding Zn-ribbon protein